MLHQKQLYWTQMLEINSLQSKEQSSCLCNDFIMVACNDGANSVNTWAEGKYLQFCKHSKSGGCLKLIVIDLYLNHCMKQVWISLSLNLI